MKLPHQTLYFRRVTCEHPDATTVTAPNRGYSLPHLLAMHLVDNERIDFYFSTELVRVCGHNLQRLWELLSTGADLALIEPSQITEIKLLPYRPPPMDFISPEAD